MEDPGGGTIGLWSKRARAREQGTCLYLRPGGTDRGGHRAVRDPGDPRRQQEYLCLVLAEEMLKAGNPSWLTIRQEARVELKSTADGKQASFPVVVFGGENADVPVAFNFMAGLQKPSITRIASRSISSSTRRTAHRSAEGLSDGAGCLKQPWRTSSYKADDEASRRR
ncbi:MAG: hypothetical protein U0793_23315 [Gemmataceae bacterium]